MISEQFEIYVRRMQALILRAQGSGSVASLSILQLEVTTLNTFPPIITTSQGLKSCPDPHYLLKHNPDLEKHFLPAIGPTLIFILALFRVEGGAI